MHRPAVGSGNYVRCSSKFTFAKAAQGLIQVHGIKVRVGFARRQHHRVVGVAAASHSSVVLHHPQTDRVDALVQVLTQRAGESFRSPGPRRKMATMLVRTPAQWFPGATPTSNRSWPCREASSARRARQAIAALRQVGHDLRRIRGPMKGPWPRQFSVVLGASGRLVARRQHVAQARWAVPAGRQACAVLSPVERAPWLSGP